VKLPLRLTEEQSQNGMRCAMIVDSEDRTFTFQLAPKGLDFFTRVVASVNALAGVPLDAIEAGAVADLLKREGLSE
jgi:hypothetical protein